MARVAERSFGLGPLEPLLRDPAVDEVMVNGVGPVWVERGGRLERTDVRFASAGELRHAIERILAPLGRRVDEAEPLCDARLPDGSRVNVVIAAAGARRPGPDDPPLPRARDERRRPRRAPGRGSRRCATCWPRAVARAPEHPRQRRHRLGQDDDAQRAVVVRAGRRAHRDDRGHRRAAPAPAPRRAPRGAAAERRGPRRGDDPPPGAQRAAHAPRPDRRRRGPRAARRSTCSPR